MREAFLPSVVLATIFFSAVAGAQDNVQDTFLQWPLPPGAERYGSIDGRHLHRYVVEQAAISRQVQVDWPR